jgi:hypothetical protein
VASFAPALDRLLAAVVERLPGPSAALETALRAEDLLDRSARLEGLPRAAKAILGQSPLAAVGDEGRRIVVPADVTEMVDTAREMVVRVAGKHGAAHLDAVIDRLDWEGLSGQWSRHGKRSPGGRGESRAAAPSPGSAAARREWSAAARREWSAAARREWSTDDTLDDELLHLAADSVDGLEWLDRDAGWFALGPRSADRLYRRIREVLSVTGRLGAGKLHAALRRDHYLQGHVPPPGPLRAYCQRMPLCRVERGQIELIRPPADPPRIHRGVEADLLRAWFKPGQSSGTAGEPTASIDELTAVADEKGISRGVLWSVLEGCPSIERFGPMRYGPRTASGRRSLAGKGKTTRRSARHEDWLESGRLRLIGRVTKAMLRHGRMPLIGDAAEVSPGQYTIRRLSGLDMGTIEVVDGAVTQLDRRLRHLDAQPGDLLVVELTPRARTASIHLADETILDARAAEDA